MSEDMPENLSEALRETCGRCGSILPGDFAFCSACGLENSHFSEKQLVKQFGTTLEEAREKCRAGHKDLLAALAENPGEAAESPYCPICGKAVTMN